MRIIFLLLLVLCLSCKTPQAVTDQTTTNPPQTGLVENTTHLQDPDLAPFFHGVASGDPLQESVLIWTRVTPKEPMDEVVVSWELASDTLFSNIIQEGQVTTSPDRDYTVKLIVENLEPRTTYYYRFKNQETYSKTGRTKTLPTNSEPVNLAFVSCSNIEFGYFNAYAAILEDDVDAVIHLGDYIYEYGPNVYGDETFARKNIPPHEIVSLQDYRDRYSQYRLDEDLQNLHGHVPFINIWDDHEITNNAYTTGAQNHQDDEGDYETRKNTAKQVFYEWIPIREGATHYRKFNFGNTLDLIMLDERLEGRTMQADSITDPRRISPDHQLLGQEQMAWLMTALSESQAVWKIIGNQVIFSYSDWGREGFRQNMDAWDGYPNDQKALSNSIIYNGVENVAFVTGDTHTAWAFEATMDPFDAYDPKTSEGAIGVEFGVTSVNSANANERYPDIEVIEHERKIIDAPLNPHLKYVNMRDHGYLKLSITPEMITAEYKTVRSLRQRNSKVRVDKRFKVEKGKARLIEM